MKYHLFIIICISILSCKYSDNSTDDFIRFDNIWSSPYRVSSQYCNQLENAEGKYLFVLNKTEWAYFAAEDPQKVLDRVKKPALIIKLQK